MRKRHASTTQQFTIPAPYTSLATEAQLHRAELCALGLVAPPRVKVETERRTP